MLIADDVHVWREPDGDYHIEWRTTEDGVRVSVEPIIELADVSGHALEYAADGVSARLSGLPAKGLQYFNVRDDFGNEVRAGQRKIALEGSPNFRDFGGYGTADGRRVKWGSLFRSGQLSALSDSDVDNLAGLGLNVVCDFRRLEEQASEPSRLPQDRPPKIVSLPIIPGSNSRFFEEADSDFGGPQAMFDFMLEINSDFALAQADTYARMFAEILAVEDAKFLVHCAAGKDRTGFAAAIMLAALGVPRAVAMSDYLLTQRFFEPEEQVQRLQQKYQMEHMDVASFRPMLEVHEAYLQRAFDTIDQAFPSVEAYLAEALGVGEAERAALRARYLE